MNEPRIWNLSWVDWIGTPPDDDPPKGDVFVEYDDGRVIGPVHADDVDWRTGGVSRWAEARRIR